MRDTISGLLKAVGAITIIGGLILSWFAIEPWLTYSTYYASGRPPVNWFGVSLGAGAMVQGVVLIAVALILEMVFDLHAAHERREGPRQKAKPKSTGGYNPYYMPGVDPKIKAAIRHHSDQVDE